MAKAKTTAAGSKREKKKDTTQANAAKKPRQKKTTDVNEQASKLKTRTKKAAAKGKTDKSC